MARIEKWFFFLPVLLLPFTLWSQQLEFHFIVTFKDKLNSPYDLTHPEEFLSSRAIARRALQGIQVNESDLPVTPLYMDSVRKVNHVSYRTHSKWFNNMVISVTDSSVLAKVRLYSFIHSIEKMPGSNDKSGSSKNDKLAILEAAAMNFESSEYGMAFNQAQMINVTYLHRNGYTGTGMRIAVIDAGFTGVPGMKVFDQLRKDNRLIATRDFVANDDDVYGNSTHGTFVLSTLAANLSGTMIGTAPGAEYLLLRSEDGAAEYLMEEHFWVAAAEYADSAGADILTTSLGYTTFDDADQDHTYEDLDGNTTFITRGSDRAAATGMLVVNSAGNSGNNDWQYIGAPADGDSVLAIGAVGPNRNYASFSSRGPSADNRVKPNVAAQGFNSALAGIEGGTFGGSGTSFSGPILCGAAACLWQTHPLKTNMEIFHAIEESADQYLHPDAKLGYGIPDFGLAYLRLKAKGNSGDGIDAMMTLLPNPFNDQLNIYLRNAAASIVKVKLVDVTGRIAFQKDYTLPGSKDYLIALNDLNHIRAGIYFLQLEMDGKATAEKVVKY